MTPARRRSLAIVAALAILLPVIAGAPLRASPQSQLPRGLSRLDATLRNALTSEQPVAQRVIIRVRPGRRLALEQQLASLGDRLVAEHPSLEAITAVVRGEDLGALADADDVLSISADAVVRPSDLIGGLLGTVTGVVKVVANVLLPNGADTDGPAVQPSTLRATLGIANSSWTGRGVGVAVVDSGLEMSAEFQGRVTAFYDFTGGRTLATSPLRRLRTWHARLGDHRRLGCAVGFGGVPRPRTSGPDRGAEGARQERRGLHERRHSGDRLRRREQVETWYRSSQLVARPPHRRARGNRSARAGRRACEPRGHHRGGRGRQLRQEPHDGPTRICGDHVSRQRSLGDHRGRSSNRRHRLAQRRSDSGLQLRRAHVVRRVREAGCRLSRSQHRGCRGEARHLVPDVSAAQGRRR